MDVVKIYRKNNSCEKLYLFRWWLWFCFFIADVLVFFPVCKVLWWFLYWSVLYSDSIKFFSFFLLRCHFLFNFVGYLIRFAYRKRVLWTEVASQKLDFVVISMFRWYKKFLYPEAIDSGDLVRCYCFLNVLCYFLFGCLWSIEIEDDWACLCVFWMVLIQVPVGEFLFLVAGIINVWYPWMLGFPPPPVVWCPSHNLSGFGCNAPQTIFASNSPPYIRPVSPRTSLVMFSIQKSLVEFDFHSFSRFCKVGLLALHANYSDEFLALYPSMLGVWGSASFHF